MKLAQSLYELQQAERTIVRNHKRIQKIEKELAQNAGIAEAQSIVDEAENVVKPLRAEHAELVDQLENTRTRRKETEERLYSGSVTNPKELTEMQQEMEALERRDTTLQTRIASTEESLAEAEIQLDDARSHLEHITDALAGEHQALAAEKRQLAAEMEKMKGIRTHLMAQLDGELIERYQQMRPRMNGQPVSVMKDDTCTVCGVMQISTRARQVRQNEELITCTNCHRILVYLG